MTDLLRFLHILFAAAWIGAALWVSGDVRRTLALGKVDLLALRARVSPALGLDLGAGGAVLVSGLVLMIMEGQVAHRIGILVGLFATLARMGVMGLALAPAWRKVEAAIGAGDLAAATAPAKKMGMFAGIAHTLWMVALAGMVFG